MADPIGSPTFPLGAVAAAIIGAMVSLAALILSKEQKISEARKEWIEGLRSDLAAFFGHVQVISLLWEAKLHDRQSNASPQAPSMERRGQRAEGLSSADFFSFRNEHKDEYAKLLTCYHHILLRTKTNSKEYEQLNTLLGDLYKQFEGNKPECYRAFPAIEKKLHDEAASKLKVEWEKVKTGEKLFRYVRTAFFLVLTAAVAVGVWRLLHA